MSLPLTVLGIFFGFFGGFFIAQAFYDESPSKMHLDYLFVGIISSIGSFIAFYLSLC